MSTALVPVQAPVQAPSLAWLREAVLAGVSSPHSRRNYAQALDELAAFLSEQGEPLSRVALLRYREVLLGRGLSASTVNVRLSAVRKLVAEARRHKLLDAEAASSMTDVPNVRQQGTRMGNWLTREQAKQLLTVPDRSTLKGKRDHVILALLLGCGLRRHELASLQLADIQQREGRWVVADLVGKGRRVRMIAVPLWVKGTMDQWTAAAKIEGADCCGQSQRPASLPERN